MVSNYRNWLRERSQMHLGHIVVQTSLDLNIIIIVSANFLPHD